MIATSSIVELLDQSDHMTQKIIQSSIAISYQKAYTTLLNDQEAQHLIKQFNRLKEDYEDIQRFGSYHPDYRDIMRNVRRAKRKMDMNDKVAAFKVAERQLQELLDDVSELIAHSVNHDIKVPREGAFLTSSCGTGCGTGGSCGCQVS